jgi:hypothetical protein
METERVEQLWQTAMKVAVAMKKEGLDTGDVVSKLRDAKVLINHCIYDEHAHGDELAKAEWETEEVQRLLISKLKEAGREDDFLFTASEKIGKKTSSFSAPPTKLSRSQSWARISLPEKMDVSEIEKIEGIEVIEKNQGSVTLSGEKAALKEAFDKISKAISK